MAPFFWFELIGGLLVLFVVLAAAKNREKRGMIVLPSMLVMLGVACKRVWLLFTGFIHPDIYGASGITSGTFAAQQNPVDMWMLLGSYTSTIVEILVAIGVVSVGVLIFVVLSNKLIAGEGVSVGFGEATFEMQRLLCEAGLRISNDNSQYADHIGIELLYLATLCEHVSRDGQGGEEAVAFASEHPLAWIDALKRRICDECDDGYYRSVVELASALLSLVSCKSAEPKI